MGNQVKEEYRAGSKKKRTDLTVLDNGEISPVAYFYLKDCYQRGMSKAEMALIFKTTPAVIAARLKSAELLEPLEEVKSFRKNKADILALTQSKIIGSIGQDCIDDANLAQKVNAFKSLQESERLELNKPNSISSHIHILQQVSNHLIAGGLPDEVEEAEVVSQC